MQNSQLVLTITLKFPNLYILWAFAKTLSSSNLQINTIGMMLTCECSETDIKRALQDYQAIVIDTPKETYSDSKALQ